MTFKKIIGYILLIAFLATFCYLWFARIDKDGWQPFYVYLAITGGVLFSCILLMWLFDSPKEK